MSRLSNRWALCVGWALAQHSLFAIAAEAPFASPDAAKTVTTSAAGSLAQVTLSLILVLGAVFASAWLVRRLRNFGRPGAGAIQIVADVALGTKERAVLIQVGAQQLLVGVAPGRVNTLHVLAEPVRTDDAQRGGGADELSPSSSPSPRPDFKSILKRSLGL
ncbi:MAG TPA: flagellar biosynthetic protein FliO [Steroidobacteraceae bacterium]|nr:flagellar biosynthetic protein FliO [Steroidobacteraceae bacterium]